MASPGPASSSSSASIRNPLASHTPLPYNRGDTHDSCTVLPMIGKTISHYRITEKLGEGGMGVVYKAEDTKLGRTVALKFLPPGSTDDPDARERFTREAQAAAALNHPNICTVFEIDEVDGRTFIAMEHVDGPTLRAEIRSGPMSVDRALDIAVGIAEALDEAHARQIVHRDVKPANIILTARGRAKVMDFGLARLAGSALLTRTGTTVGTAAYMSPEQARGLEVDRRSDLWSLGVVIYEMVAGRRPFTGGNELSILRAIMTDEPDRLDVHRNDAPPAVVRIVARALAKDASARYASASELLHDLTAAQDELSSRSRTQASAAAEPDRSIAVLPFADMSPDGDQEYFCDGMAEEIINALTQLEGLRVVARTSAFAFKGRNEDIREIGRKLSVGNLLEGSVRKAGDRLRITAQLINVGDGCHLWSERYDRELADVFAIQDEITLAIVEKLRMKLLGDVRERLIGRQTESLEAYWSYLRGRQLWTKRTSESMEEAMACFEKAIALDPGYALAYDALAQCIAASAHYRRIHPAEIHMEAKAAALKALELDETLAGPHATLGGLLCEGEWDWDGAERGFKRALELDPGHATTRQWYAELLLLLGRTDDAMREAKLAVELDPLSPIMNARVGLVLYCERKYEDAERQLRTAIALDPEYLQTYMFLADALASQSRLEEAVEAARNTGLPGVMAYFKGLAGDTDAARTRYEELLEEMKETYVWPTLLADLCRVTGDMDTAFEWLEKAADERDVRLPYKIHGPWGDAYRDDPRFAEIAKRMGLA